MKIKMDELLLIAGTGRNSGKTTMACAVIRNVSQHQPIVAIKITPHFHDYFTSDNLLIDRNDLVIMVETQTGTDKDSSRMLVAGAEQVYFVMATDERLSEAMQIISGVNTKKRPLVCESGGLIHYFEPALFLMMSRADQTEFKPESDALAGLADLRISFDGVHPNFNPETITYSSNKWQLAPKY